MFNLHSIKAKLEQPWLEQKQVKLGEIKKTDMCTDDGKTIFEAQCFNSDYFKGRKRETNCYMDTHIKAARGAVNGADEKWPNFPHEVKVGNSWVHENDRMGIGAVQEGSPSEEDYQAAIAKGTRWDGDKLMVRWAKKIPYSCMPDKWEDYTLPKVGDAEEVEGQCSNGKVKFIARCHNLIAGGEVGKLMCAGLDDRVFKGTTVTHADSAKDHPSPVNKVEESSDGSLWRVFYKDVVGKCSERPPNEPDPPSSDSDDTWDYTGTSSEANDSGSSAATTTAAASGKWTSFAKGGCVKDGTRAIVAKCTGTSSSCRSAGAPVGNGFVADGVEPDSVRLADAALDLYEGTWKKDDLVCLANKYTGLPDAAIIGIVVGAGVLLLLVVLMAMAKRKKNNS